MGKNTKIEWAHHTFNPWIGCTKVLLPDGSLHPACLNCYAEAESKRRGWAKWGKGKPRHRTTAGNWSKPLAWDRAAGKQGIRERVFCASLSDIFDAEVSQEWRDDLFVLIDHCPSLDWLILTKRLENILLMIPPQWKENPPKNVLMGTSVSDQLTADEFIPRLLRLSHLFTLFVSIEPLLGEVKLGIPERKYVIPRKIIEGYDDLQRQLFSSDEEIAKHQELTRRVAPHLGRPQFISWVIVGGESGPSARPMNPKWVRSIRDECTAAGVPFLFKQWGEYMPARNIEDAQSAKISLCYESGDWINSWGDPPQVQPMIRVGKKRAGRLLDGKEYSEFPEVKA